MKEDYKKPQERLLPLMFEVGRLLKSETTRNGTQALSFLHVETLRFIQEKEQPAMSDIAEYLKIARPSATALVNSFVKDGILERAPDVADRRVVRLILSTKGKNLLKETMRAREKAFAKMTASLSAKDCTELSRILTIITKNPLSKNN